MPLSQRRAALVRRLRRRRSREREDAVLVEGVRAVAEALRVGATARFAVVSPRVDSTLGGRDVRRGLAIRGVEAHLVDDSVLAELSDTEHPQGVLLVCEQPKAGSDALSATGHFLVLDGVQDPGNAGTLVRVATAFGLDGVIALEGTVDLWGAKTVRASAGMAFGIPLLGMTAQDLLGRAARGEIRVLVADADGVDVSGLEPGGGWALVVGNEGAGSRPEVVEAGLERVRVPMQGPAESLNVGMAGAILLYALTRERAVGR